MFSSKIYPGLIFPSRTSKFLFQPILHETKVLLMRSQSLVNNRGTSNVFDEKTKIHQKTVAAKYQDEKVYDYLKNEVFLLL